MLPSDSPSQTPCPCCGLAIPAGLFARRREVEAPVALQAIARSEDADDILAHEGGLLTMYSRAFVPAIVNLPLYWQDSPVSARVWVEVPYHSGDDYIRFRDGTYPHFLTSGWLACDVPGFPGSFGAQVQIEAHRGSDLPVLTWCADLRILLLGRDDDFGHDHLVRLYRRMWGGSGDTPAEDPALRKAVSDTVERHFGPYYVKPIEPIAPYAGIEPPQVLVRPPLDTGGEARFATVGNAEATKGPRKTELVAAVRDSAEPFEKSFAEFCFWSRREANPPLMPGMVIPETQGSIPAYERMVAWLLVDDFDTAEGSLVPPPVEVGPATVVYLAAIPITREELAFAASTTVGELITRLEVSGVDIADLSRNSCVSVADVSGP